MATVGGPGPGGAHEGIHSQPLQDLATIEGLERGHVHRAPIWSSEGETIEGDGMTCIVGLTDGKTVWMGGDSCGTNGYTKDVTKHPKVIVRETHGNRLIVGYTGSFRMGQVLEHKLDIPRNENDDDAYKFMVCTVIDALRTLFKAEGCITTTDGQDSTDGPFLVGYRGRLFEVQSDYSVIENTRGYVATGSGKQVAEGAMFAAPNLKPEPRIMRALEAAAEFVPTVAGPFYVMTLCPSI